MESKDLVVQIESEGGLLTLTPQGLLEHFLPGAAPYRGSPRIFEGHFPGQTDKKCYVQTEALAGMLMEAREKHINPISGMYLIPSSTPDRPAGHKIKYDVGIQRARKIPGFLGMNMGLLVKRDKQTVETSGEMSLEGDVIVGAWAEVYIAGLPRPLRKEVSKREFWGNSKVWNEKGGFMLCKVAVDHLLRTNYPALYAEETAEEGKGEVVLEAAGQTASQPATHEQERGLPDFAFEPNTRYAGTIKALLPRDGKKAGQIVVETEHGELACFFWSRPEILKDHQDWSKLIGFPCGLTFSEKTDKNGTWRYAQDFDIATGPTEEQPGLPMSEGPQEAA